MQKPLSSCLLPLLAAALTAASSAHAAEENTGSTSQPIISGSASPSSQNAVVMLVHVENGNGGETCTATLVASNLLITARHCVSETGKQPFYCDKNGKVQNDGNGGGEVGADYKATDLYVFTGTTRPVFNGTTPAQAAARGKKIFHDNATAVCGHDLALVLLENNVSSTIPLARIRLDSQASKGEKITAVGWGVTLDTKYPAQRQQRTGIPIVQVGPYSDDRVDVPGNDFLVGESTCSGDSGGPGFSEDTGALIGVVSRGGNGKDATNPADGCTNADNDYTQTAPFKSLIQSAFNESGNSPLVETGRPTNNGSGGDDGGCSASPASSRSMGAGAGLVALGIALATVRRTRRRRIHS
ncbi:trypsin-like serine protease [Pendulispora brunnea]|uniref:Trypsin-like serine protease n=1 Tax=Pendulispora brunnea TaxID=2905690 RepID=A0ABZ2K6I8_9BACT